MGFFIWNIYNKMSLTLDEVTKTNSELVLTNSSLIKNMDNKIDKLEESELFELMQLYSNEDLFKAIVPISALKGRNVNNFSIYLKI